MAKSLEIQRIVSRETRGIRFIESDAANALRLSLASLDQLGEVLNEFRALQDCC
jgi:hypothetical protein